MVGAIELGLIEFNWTFIFQIFNLMVILLGIYVLIKIVMKAINWKRGIDNKLKSIEQKVSELVENKK